MIYLDNAATTKMSAEVLQVMERYACDCFYNPSANYTYAIKVAKELDLARADILKMLGASGGDLIFTSGATESNNLAIRGSVRNGDWEYVFSLGEHPSVYNVALELKQQGKKVTFVPIGENGEINYKALEGALNEKTRLISVIHVSNETGAVNDIKRIDDIRKRLCPKAILHVDGVQAVGKIPVNLDRLNVDLYSFSGHKFHGPKGVGGLYVRNKQSLKPIVFGGGQEGGIRSGTENVPAIMGMRKALEICDVESNLNKMQRLKESFLKEFRNKLAIKYINTQCPYIISMSFSGVNGETLMRALEKDVVISTGSACSSRHAGNRILNEMGFSIDYIKSSVRVSFDSELSEGDVTWAGRQIIQVYEELLEKVR